MERWRATRWMQRTRQASRDDSGAIMVITALVLTSVIGLVAMAVEVGSWYVVRRQLQTAADAAALAGAVEVAQGNSGQTVASATREVTRNGLTLDTNTVLVVNNPPSTGTRTSDTNAVEAIITRRQPLLFSALFLGAPVDIESRAVASLREDGGDACVLALDTSQSGAVGGTGNADVTMPGCMIASNSTSEQAIRFTGNIDLTAQTLWTAGNVSYAGNGSISLTHPASVKAWPLADPYAGVGIPAVGGCTYTNHKVNHSSTLSPGVYCDGLDISGNATITLNPGTYFINRGDLTVQGNVRFQCNCAGSQGVTFVFTSTTQTSRIGGADIRGNVSMTLRAPSDASDPFRGILFYQDRNAPSNGVSKFNGNAALDLTGAMYFPNQEIQWTGNNSMSTAGCVQIVARVVTFTGNAGLDNAQCAAVGARPISSTPVRLYD